MSLDEDDIFKIHLKEQEYRKQKKFEKQERINNKMKLINEIKKAINENKQRAHTEDNTIYQKNTIDWALQTLQLEPFSSLAEAKKNYLQLAQHYHPDKNDGQEIQKMKDLNEAWQLVKKFYQTQP